MKFKKIFSILMIMNLHKYSNNIAIAREKWTTGAGVEQPVQHFKKSHLNNNNKIIILRVIPLNHRRKITIPTIIKISKTMKILKINKKM